MRGVALTRIGRAAAPAVLAVLLVACTTGDAPAAPLPPPAPMIHSVGPAPAAIVVAGDSVAYGAHDTVRGGWVTRLARTLAAAFPRAHLRLRNLAHNGGNTADLIRDLRHLSRGPHPALLIIAYGLNDFDERVSRSTMAAHLRAALNVLHAWRPRPAVVLVGLPPITALDPARLRAEHAYTETMRHVARVEGAGYLDQFDLWLALGPLLMHRLRHDTEHPNPAGYAFTAAVVAAFLEGAYLDRDGRIQPPRTLPTCATTLCTP